MTSEPADAAKSVRDTLFRTMVEVRRHYMKSSALTLGQASILGILVEQGPTNAGKLATLERVAGPTMKGRIDRLEELGLVTRHRCGPRSPVRVEITRHGIRAHRAAANDVLAALLDELSETDLRRLHRALEPLDQLLDRHADQRVPSGH